MAEAARRRLTLPGRWLQHRGQSMSPHPVRTESFRVSAKIAVVAWVLYALAAWCVHDAARPQADPRVLALWSIGVVLLLVVWVSCAIVVLVRQPEGEELDRVWGPVTQAILVSCDVVVVCGIWGFMPQAEREAMLVMSFFFFGHVPAKVLCSPENTLLNRLTVLAVFGSLVGCLLWIGGQPAAMLASFIAVFGVVMLLVSDVVRKAMTDEIEARRRSDETGRALERALSAVAAERDAKTRFIATASHDLAQPLQAANLFFDQALRAPDAALRDQACTGVRQALQSAEQILGHLLNHLRLEADAVQPHLSPLSLDQAFGKVVRRLQPAANEAAIDLRALPNCWVIASDPSLIDRAVGNLILNAIAHSAGRRALVFARRHGPKHLRLWVLDDGRGINRVDANHVFEDYYQSIDAHPAAKTGFGLGLASVRRIAKLLHGQAGLDRRWLRGAAFYIELPMSCVVERRHSARHTALPGGTPHA